MLLAKKKKRKSTSPPSFLYLLFIVAEIVVKLVGAKFSLHIATPLEHIEIEYMPKVE